MQVPVFSDVLEDVLEDSENVKVFKALGETKSIEVLESEFGKDVKKILKSLRNAGLVVTIFRNNPSELHEYYKRTAFGEKIASKLG